MRFVHAADIHLDSPLRSMALRAPEVERRLAQASRATLAAIVQLTIDERADALVLAGDVFDNDVPDMTARTALIAQLSRLRAAGIPVVLIRGNHDGLLDHGALGDDVHLLDAERSTVRIGDATFHGVSFEGRHVAESLLPAYSPAEPGRLNVGVMHTSLGGSPDHDRYAPCALDDLLGHGYDYWALGHIHKRAEYRRDRMLAVMPGIPQGRHVREEGRGSVTLVTLGHDAPGAEVRPVAGLVFETREIELEGGLDQVAVFDALAAGLLAAERLDCDVALRVRLTGPGALALARDPAAALETLRAAAEDVDGVHVETVRIVADAIDASAAPSTASSAVAGGLVALVGEELAKPGFEDEARDFLAEFRRALPREIRNVVEDDELEALLADARGMAGAVLSGL